jgi:hypothetical protein
MSTFENAKIGDAVRGSAWYPGYSDEEFSGVIEDISNHPSIGRILYVRTNNVLTCKKNMGIGDLDMVVVSSGCTHKLF